MAFPSRLKLEEADASSLPLSATPRTVHPVDPVQPEAPEVSALSTPSACFSRSPASHERDPARAVAELVWNSLDADANDVSVTLRRNDAEGVVGVSVVDDGHGIPPESVESSFKWIGNSWKSRTL
jgi:signal transduction histidine kinase